MAELEKPEHIIETLSRAFDPNGDRVVTVKEAEQHLSGMKNLLNNEKNETPVLPLAGDLLTKDLVAATRNELKQAGLKAETGREEDVVKILADSKREVIADTNRKFFDRDGDGVVKKNEMEKALDQLKENGVKLDTNEIKEAIKSGGVTMSKDASEFLESSAVHNVPNSQQQNNSRLR